MYLKLLKIKINTMLKTPATIYRQPEIKYTTPLYEKYTASHITKTVFTNITMITRRTTYATLNHKKGRAEPISNRTEEILAIKLFNKHPRIIDYQIPLSDKKKDRAGKIDFLYVDKEKHTLVLCELKASNSKESPLKAIYEIYTYYNIVDRTKLLADYNTKYNLDLNSIECAVIAAAASKFYSRCQSTHIKKVMADFSIRLGIVDPNKLTITS